MNEEQLARIFNNSLVAFEERINKKFEGAREEMKQIEANLSQKINGLSNRIDQIVLHYPNREEFQRLSLRVEKIEEKVGLK